MRQHDRPLPPKLTQQVAQELHTQVEVTHEVAIRVVAIRVVKQLVLHPAMFPVVLPLAQTALMTILSS